MSGGRNQKPDLQGLEIDRVDLEGIPTPVLDSIFEAQLSGELARVLDIPRAVRATLTKNGAFLAAAPVTEVLEPLIELHEHECLVIWRDDHDGFWSQNTSARYLDTLKENRWRETGFLNQTRVRIYDGRDGDDLLQTHKDQVLSEMLLLHAPESLRGLDLQSLRNLSLPLSALRFGVTICPTLGVAVIPVPAACVHNAQDLDRRSIEKLLALGADYEATDGPLRGVVTADQVYVRLLAREFDIIRRRSEPLDRDGDGPS